jgi:hypothetical protein
MRLKLMTGCAALALGTALASVPAFAEQVQQQPAFHYATGKAANDGGNTASPNTPGGHDGSAASAQPIYNSVAPQQYHYPMGKSANDGGMAGTK